MYFSIYLYRHCVKSARIRSCSDPHFPTFGLNRERYSVSFRIQSECGKIWTRITPNTISFRFLMHFFVVLVSLDRKITASLINRHYFWSAGFMEAELIKSYSPWNLWKAIGCLIISEGIEANLITSLKFAWYLVQDLATTP